jgi:hypothetical protein
MRGRDKLVRRSLAAMALGCAGATAHAAGGHHGVDDAELLPQGACGQETWFSRARDGERLLHAGVGCGVGPIELDAAVEHARGDSASATAWNLEVKWARAIAQGFSTGLDLQPVWLAHRSPRYTGARLAAMATWKPDPMLSLHFNAGSSIVRGDRDLPNGGLAAAWSPVARWSFVAERYLENETHFLRGGARWAAGRQWNVDLSYASRLSGRIPSFWTLGLAIAFGDD